MGNCDDFHGFCSQLLWIVGRKMVLRLSRGRSVCSLPSCTNLRFPGVQFYLSCWYKRKEFGVRSAVFFSAAALSGSFGGLLAAAIANMNGLGGKAGWAWIVPPIDISRLTQVHSGRNSDFSHRSYLILDHRGFSR